MTISLDERRKQQREVLRVFVEDIGDDYAMVHILDASDARFAEVDESSWTELAQRGYVEEHHSMGCPSYALTDAGWLKGIEIRGDLVGEAFRERCFKLVKALKRLVGEEGRRIHHDEIADERDLAGETQLPAGWMWNILKSGCLSAVVKDKRMDVYYDHRNQCFRVKPTFGMPIDLEPL